MLEAVVNVAEGSRAGVVRSLAELVGPSLLDVHSDAWHNRSVLTIAGADLESSVRALATAVVATLDIRVHEGAHPRLGVLDVVPFVPIRDPCRPDVSGELTEALAARDSFAAWAGEVLGLPCFLYGPDRSLPEIRRGAFATVVPDTGPRRPHPTAGATCVGARGPLVAYNLWLDGCDVTVARAVARSIRSPEVRALGLALGEHAQVSCNLVAPERVGPGAVYDAVAALAPVSRAELVGLLPRQVLDAEPRSRWRQLDLGAHKTIEHRLSARVPP